MVEKQYMKQIILIRHTETASASINLKQAKNSLDLGLSEKGKEQALEIRSFLKDFDYQVIFTSLYRRSRETAVLINEKAVQNIFTNAFNEYYVDSKGQEIEGTSDGAARAMTKMYSIFNLYENMVIVAHSSINQTILQSLLNLKFDKARTYFNKFGETQVLRYFWEKGDTNWTILQSFIPKQD